MTTKAATPSEATTTRREPENAASNATMGSQISANEPMPPFIAATKKMRPARDAVEMKVRALEPAGAGQIKRRKDRQDQPGENRDFDGGGRASAGEQDQRQRREGQHAAGKMRLDEGTVARRRNIVARDGRVHEAPEILVDCRERRHERNTTRALTSRSRTTREEDDRPRLSER